MSEKKFKHKKIEICRICDKEIDTTTEMWAVIIDYDGNKETGIGFYHRKCLNDLIKGKVSVIERKWKERMTDMVVSILGKAKGRGLIPS